MARSFSGIPEQRDPETQTPQRGNFCRVTLQGAHTIRMCSLSG
jgi:hypothetical protein